MCLNENRTTLTERISVSSPSQENLQLPDIKLQHNQPKASVSTAEQPKWETVTVILSTNLFQVQWSKIGKLSWTENQLDRRRRAEMDSFVSSLGLSCLLYLDRDYSESRYLHLSSLTAVFFCGQRLQHLLVFFTLIKIQVEDTAVLWPRVNTRVLLVEFWWKNSLGGSTKLREKSRATAAGLCWITTLISPLVLTGSAAARRMWWSWTSRVAAGRLLLPNWTVWFSFNYLASPLSPTQRPPRGQRETQTGLFSLLLTNEVIRYTQRDQTVLLCLCRFKVVLKKTDLLWLWACCPLAAEAGSVFTDYLVHCFTVNLLLLNHLKRKPFHIFKTSTGHILYLVGRTPLWLCLLFLHCIYVHHHHPSPATGSALRWWCSISGFHSVKKQLINFYERF